MSTELADILTQHMHRADCSAGRLSRLSGVPLRTLENWINGSVQKPRNWQAILQIAATLHLSATNTDCLLQAAGRPLLNELQKTAVSPQDRTLLQTWSPPQLTSPSSFQAVADLP